MCLRIRDEAKEAFTTNEDGDYVVYKVLTHENKSSFAAAWGFQWKKGENIAELDSREYFSDGRPGRSSLETGFHFCACLSDALALCDDLNNGLWNQWEPRATYKVVQCTVKPQDVIAFGVWSVNRRTPNMLAGVCETDLEEITRCAC